MKKRNLFTRMLSLVLCLAMVAPWVPTGVWAEGETLATADKVVDASTVNGWQDVFPKDSTENAGGIWVDKSVFANSAKYLTDTKEEDNGISDYISVTEKNNFLVAMSAMASTKSITGYSTIPTDTVFVLDMSSSMEGGTEDDKDYYNYIDDLAVATNAAIQELMALNPNNRIAVVLYSGAADQKGGGTLPTRVLMPLDTYLILLLRILIGMERTISSNIRNFAALFPTIPLPIPAGGMRRKASPLFPTWRILRTKRSLAWTEMLPAGAPAPLPRMASMWVPTFCWMPTSMWRARTGATPRRVWSVCPSWC